MPSLLKTVEGPPARTAKNLGLNAFQQPFERKVVQTLPQRAVVAAGVLTAPICDPDPIRVA